MNGLTERMELSSALRMITIGYSTILSFWGSPIFFKCKIFALSIDILITRITTFGVLSIQQLRRKFGQPTVSGSRKY